MQTSLCPFCMSEVQGETCPYCGRNISCAGDPTHLPAGYILEDKRNYILGTALGQGGFGVTYIAWDEKRKQKVAIKEYFPTYCSSRLDGRTVSAYRGQEETYLKGKERFLDEARMLKSLSDLNSVVNVLDFFEANNSAYLVMEYLEGMSLKDCIQRNGKLPAQQFLNQLKPLMADMEKMHRRGVIHRDIAPDNIILLPDGRLKLIDFGAARSYVGDKSMTVVVKKGFAPVEQYMRKGSNASTDVYALAATIYYCITGIVPPDSAERQYGEVSLRSPIMLGADLLPHQEGALEQALQIQPQDRTQSISDFLKVLFNAPLTVPVQPAAVAPAKEKTIKPKQEKTKKPKTIRPAEKKRISGKIWIIAAVLSLCVCIGIVVAGMDWTAVTETVEQLAAEQTEPAETQPEETLSPEAEAYNEAVDFFHNGEYGKAAIAFAKLGDFRDAKEISHKIWDAIAVRDTIYAENGFTAAVHEDGTVSACGNLAPDVSDWTDIIAISRSSPLMLGLRSDGSVVATDTRNGSREIIRKGWEDVVAIDTDGCTIFGLKMDGTVVAYQEYEYADWRMDEKELAVYLDKIAALEDIIEFNVTTAKTADGRWLSGLDLQLSKETDIVDSAESHLGTAILKEDGSAHFEIWEERVSFRKEDQEKAAKMEAEINSWKDIVCFASSEWENILGLKKDGTVVGAGDNTNKQLTVGEWTDIVAVDISSFHAVGLRSDGTLITCGSTRNNARGPAEKWTDIRLPAEREKLLAQIHPGQTQSEKPVQAEPAMPEFYYQENVLMEVKDPDNLKRDSKIFNTTVMRDDVASITFLDTLQGAPKRTVDASQEKNGKVKAWAVEKGDLYDIYVAAEGGVCPPANAEKLFAEMPALSRINFGDAFCTDRVTNMSGMFSGCKSLTELDVSGFDTSVVTDMSYLFYGCEKLTDLKLDQWDTSCVTNMEYMFAVCESIEKLLLAGFDTGAVTNMCSMFASCKKIEMLDLSNFDTSGVSNMGAMFSRCSGLTALDVSSFDTSCVTDMGGMILRCEKLPELDLRAFDTSNVVNMKSMFMNCYKLEQLDISGFDVSSVRDMEDMFTKCPAQVPGWYQE